MKEGGKSGTWRHPDFKETAAPASAPAKLLLEGVRVAIVTVSDRCARGESDDRSGPELMALCKKAGAELLAATVVSDDISQIQHAVLQLVRDQGAQVVITTGGTGLSPRDVTPEALESLWTKKIPGIGEYLRAQGASQVAMSWLSRSGAGVIDRSLVVFLPGSVRAVQQGFSLLEELLPHALHVVNGGGH